MIQNRHLQWLLLFLMVLAFSSLLSTACAPDLSEGDGGLRFCNNAADCTKRLGDGFTCRLHLCQRVDKCVGENQPCSVPGAKGICAKGITTCSNGAIVCKAVEKKKDAEICGNQLDDDCNGEVDENPPCSCKPGESRSCFDGKAGCTFDQAAKKWNCDGICKAGTQTCNTDQKWGACLGFIEADVETCNGKDDNCNGKVDDNTTDEGQACGVIGAKGPCSVGKTACESGKIKCSPTVKPAPKEDCNNTIDDDCNGIVNDNPPCECKQGEVKDCYTGPSGTIGKGECKTGKQTCTPDNKPGACIGAVVPVAEICDGKDNDCDGSTDEDFPGKGASCKDTSRKGECARGIVACENGKEFCKQTVKPTTEVCASDGKDEDCDGLINEKPECTCTEGATQKCGLDTGLCSQGTQTCDANGSFGACVGEVKPAKEICDGKDNDCDGKVDNGFNVGSPCTVGVGECKASGKVVCRNNAAACSATPKPAGTESCNGKDDDCDGKIDDIPPRPCYSGRPGTENVGECKGGMQICSNGQPSLCLNQVVPKPADTPGSGKDENCDGKTTPLNNACKDMTGAQTISANKIVGCNCPTPPCSPTEALALCGAGWRVCSLTDWQARPNPATTTSDRDRYIAASMVAKEFTCPCDGTDCNGASIKSEASLCAPSKDSLGRTRYWVFFVGPNLNSPIDCASKWSKWPIAQTNKLSGRSTSTRSPQAETQAACLAWKNASPGHINGKGIMCCR